MRLSGDPVPLLLPPDAPRSEIFRVRAELGLDRPLPVQYGVFLANLARGDFGRSIHFREPAFDVVRGYLAATLELGLTAFVLAALVAVPIGLFSAMRRNTMVDHAAMGLALIGQSAPTFFLGILFILLLSLKADLFPTSGRGDWRTSSCRHARRVHDGFNCAPDSLGVSRCCAPTTSARRAPKDSARRSSSPSTRSRTPPSRS
jgi:peptide/nickel transport system permease protein